MRYLLSRDAKMLSGEKMDLLNHERNHELSYEQNHEWNCGKILMLFFHYTTLPSMILDLLVNDILVTAF